VARSKASRPRYGGSPIKKWGQILIDKEKNGVHNYDPVVGNWDRLAAPGDPRATRPRPGVFPKLGGLIGDTSNYETIKLPFNRRSQSSFFDVLNLVGRRRRVVDLGRGLRPGRFGCAIEMMAASAAPGSIHPRGSGAESVFARLPNSPVRNLMIVGPAPGTQRRNGAGCCAGLYDQMPEPKVGGFRWAACSETRRAGAVSDVTGAPSCRGAWIKKRVVPVGRLRFQGCSAGRPSRALALRP